MTHLKIGGAPCHGSEDSRHIIHCQGSDLLPPLYFGYANTELLHGSPIGRKLFHGIGLRYVWLPL